MDPCFPVFPASQIVDSCILMVETLWTKSRLVAFGSEMASSGLLLRHGDMEFGQMGRSWTALPAEISWGKKRGFHYFLNTQMPLSLLNNKE